METNIKQETFSQLTDLLAKQEKSIEDYQFIDVNGPYIYIMKKDGLKMMMGLIGYNIADVTDESNAWQQHKLSTMKIFDKLDSLCNKIDESDKQDEPVDIMCNINTYLSRSILCHFSQEKNGVKITNPTMFSNMNIYMLTFKNLDVLKRFVGSKLFYKVKDIV